MSKKFSILKSVDTNKLDKQINEYEYTTGEEPYLFMSNATGNAIINELFNISTMPPTEIEKMLRFITPGVKTGTYKGINIYENNDLAFGEVEIR